MTTYRVERLRRDGTWRQISGEGVGGLLPCINRFNGERETMKRGTIRIVSDDGRVVKEYTPLDLSPAHMRRSGPRPTYSKETMT